MLDLLTRSLVREWTHHDLSCEALHTNTTPLTPVSVRFSSRPCRHLSSCCCWLCKQWCLPREVGHHQVYTRVMYDQDIIVCPGSRLEHRLPCLISSRTLGESSTINLLHEGRIYVSTHAHAHTHTPVPHPSLQICRRHGHRGWIALCLQQASGRGKHVLGMEERRARGEQNHPMAGFHHRHCRVSVRNRCVHGGGGEVDDCK